MLQARAAANLASVFEMMGEEEMAIKHGMLSADLFAKLDDRPKETRILTRLLLSYIATKNFSSALSAGMRILRVTDDPALKKLTEMRIATIKVSVLCAMHVAHRVV